MGSQNCCETAPSPHCHGFFLLSWLLFYCHWLHFFICSTIFDPTFAPYFFFLIVFYCFCLCIFHGFSVSLNCQFCFPLPLYIFIPSFCFLNFSFFLDKYSTFPHLILSPSSAFMFFTFVCVCNWPSVAVVVFMMCLFGVYNVQYHPVMPTRNFLNHGPESTSTWVD